MIYIYLYFQNLFCKTNFTYNRKYIKWTWSILRPFNFVNINHFACPIRLPNNVYNIVKLLHSVSTNNWLNKFAIINTNLGVSLAISFVALDSMPVEKTVHSCYFQNGILTICCLK